MPDEEPPSTAVRVKGQKRAGRGRRFSEILRSMAEEPSRERISIQDMLSAMGDRAFGPLMLLFALPNLLPTPPGTSAVLGIPLIILAAQLMLGRKPWLPAVIGNRSLPRSNFAALLERAGPWLARAERLVKPRLAMLVTPPAEYAIGALCFILAIILALPIPLGNILPALAICLFSFGILERDGVWVIAGFIASLVSVSVAAGVLLALLKGLFFVIEKTFN